MPSVEPGSVVAGEVAFALVHAPTKVAPFPAPQETGCLLLPNPVRLAFNVEDTNLVWEINHSEFLLDSGPILSQPQLLPDKLHFEEPSFSSGGRFFACITATTTFTFGRNRSLATHPINNFQSTPFRLFSQSHPFFSPNGESFVNTTASKSNHATRMIKSSPPPITQSGKALGVTSSPNSLDEALAAFVRREEDTVVI